MHEIPQYFSELYQPGQTLLEPTDPYFAVDSSRTRYDQKGIFLLGDLSDLNTAYSRFEFNGSEELIDYLQSQPKIVIVDLFSGSGIIPLGVLKWLGDKQILKFGKQLQIYSVSITEKPQYSADLLRTVVNQHPYDLSTVDILSQKVKAALSELGTSAIKPGTLDNLEVNHYNLNALTALQIIPSESIDLMTLFNGSEPFWSWEFYVRSIKPKESIDQAKKILNNHVARLLRPGGYFFFSPNRDVFSLDGLDALDPAAKYPSEKFRKPLG